VKRDYAQYPDDENGDVLWSMLEDGDNLATPREVDFSVVFPTEESAMNFAVVLLRNGQKVSFSPYEGKEGFPWQVHAHPVMAPTHENVSGYEQQLAIDAAAFGGANDGWGCFAHD
jgi:hypothetical protein